MKDSVSVNAPPIGVLVKPALPVDKSSVPRFAEKAHTGAKATTHARKCFISWVLLKADVAEGDALRILLVEDAIRQ